MGEKRQYTEDERTGTLGVVAQVGSVSEAAKRLGLPKAIVQDWASGGNRDVEGHEVNSDVMLQKVTLFEWTPERERAAVLIAEDKLSDTKIAEECGIVRMTLTRWRQEPEFMQRVYEHREDIRQEIRSRSITDITHRIDVYQSLWKSMQQVIDERALDAELANIPGGKTGLVVKDLKGVGKGEDFQLVEVYSVDTALLKELRATAQQAAQELGQWAVKSETNVNVRNLDAAESLDSKLDSLASRIGADAVPGSTHP